MKGRINHCIDKLEQSNKEADDMRQGADEKKRIKCPHCGSKDTARYIYGYPKFDEEMQKKLDEGKWALGGCCISYAEVNGVLVRTMPARRCNKCEKDFASAPILITAEKNLAEDYRDIVRSIRFSVGGYLAKLPRSGTVRTTKAQL